MDTNDNWQQIDLSCPKCGARENWIKEQTSSKITLTCKTCGHKISWGNLNAPKYADYQTERRKLAQTIRILADEPFNPVCSCGSRKFRSEITEKDGFVFTCKKCKKKIVNSNIQDGLQRLEDLHKRYPDYCFVDPMITLLKIQLFSKNFKEINKKVESYMKEYQVATFLSKEDVIVSKSYTNQILDLIRLQQERKKRKRKIIKRSILSIFCVALMLGIAFGVYYAILRSKINKIFAEDGIILGEKYDLGLINELNNIHIEGANGVLFVTDDGTIESIGIGNGKIRCTGTFLNLDLGTYDIKYYNEEFISKVKQNFENMGIIKEHEDITDDNIQSLRELSLSGLDLQDSNVFEEIKVFKNLKELNISNCKINDVKPIKNIKTLESLIMDNIRINDINEYIDTIDSLSGLKKLSIVSAYEYLNRDVHNKLAQRVHENRFDVRFFYPNENISNEYTNGIYVDKEVFFNFSEFRKAFETEQIYTIGKINKEKIALFIINDKNEYLNSTNIFNINNTIEEFEIFGESGKVYDFRFNITSDVSLGLHNVNISNNENYTIIKATNGTIKLYVYGDNSLIVNNNNGTTGSSCVDVCNIDIAIKDANASLRIVGGNGKDKTTTAPNESPGSKGYNGGVAILCKNISTTSGDIKIIGGAGGKGEIGGYHWLGRGYTGGTGGDGGNGINYSKTCDIKEGQAIGGTGGPGGKGGEGKGFNDQTGYTGSTGSNGQSTKKIG